MTLVVRKSTLREILTVAFAVAIALVPWQDIFEIVHGYPFVDRKVYVDYFLYQTSVLEYVQLDSFIRYISAEFIWHFSVGLLVNDLGVPIDLVFGAISFVVLLVFAKIVVLHAGVRWLPLLINPLVIDFAFSQLRLALAIAMLGVAFLAKDRARILALILCSVTPFIHTAALIFIAIPVSVYGMRWATGRFCRGQVFELGGLLALGASISMLVGPLREAVLSSVGDRRADYHDMSSSIAYSIFWVSLLVPFFLGYRSLLRHDFVRYTMVILSLVAVNLLHGGYSTRFLAATFPFIIASVGNVRGGAALPITLAFIGYATLQWLYWFRILGG